MVTLICNNLHFVHGPSNQIKMSNTKKRGFVKGQLTRMEKFFDEESENATDQELDVRMQSLPKLLEKFLNIQDEIESTASDDMINEEEDERIRFESRYFNILARYKGKLSERSTAGTQNDERQNAIAPKRSHLPNIDLPSFDGKVSTWFTFLDTFTSLVHNDRSIDNIRKFHYLKKCVGGEARGIIDSIPVTENNYIDAWNALNNRYNDKKAILDYHINELFNQQKIKSENFTELRGLIDNTKKHAQALKSLGVQTDTWDLVFIYTITSRLDGETKKQWDLSLAENEIPTFEDLIKFLERTCYALRNHKFQEGNSTKTSRHNKASSFLCSSNNTLTVTCSICERDHKPYKCPQLLSMAPRDRANLIKKKGLCFKCFTKGHVVAQCKSFDCRTCGKKHNTLLHTEKEEEDKDKDNISTTTSLSSQNCNQQILLATAMVRVKDCAGNFVMCRALLDSGSQSNFISGKMANRLGSKLQRSNVSVNGISDSKSRSSFKLTCNVSSSINDFDREISCLVLEKITSILPAKPIDTQKWKFLDNFTLADPTFATPGKVDMLLGAELYEEIVSNGKSFKASMNLPTLRQTVFGWTVIGKVETYENREIIETINAVATMEDLSRNIRKFWELEEIPENSEHVESTCEQSFKNSVCRLSDGRFQVDLPFEIHNGEKFLGESKTNARRLLLSGERRQILNPKLRKEYIRFIEEYKEMGHMELVPKEELSLPEHECYYLPHHAVFKETSTTTKIRVVFNASSKTKSGYSLNDLLADPPEENEDIFTMLCRFRFHKVALIADVAKMYRQIMITPKHRNFLRILWRNSTEDPIEEYRLTTVTYGTKPASHSARRAMKQLSMDYESKYPKACKVIREDRYMDDFLTGTDTIDGAIRLRNELIEITNSGCFPLRKWSSNKREVISDLGEGTREYIDFLQEDSESIRTLGMIWHPNSDNFRFVFTFNEKNATKRNIISDIAKIFDPLGLLSPLVVKGKILIQNLWIKKVAWDEIVDDTDKVEWISFRNELNSKHSLDIQRIISSTEQITEYSIHAFCDSSKAAYAAAVYIRGVDMSNNVTCNLLCAKTRVSPLKPTTIPRLELCSAVLLAKLVSRIHSIMNVEIRATYLWSDSQIVLHWLNGNPNRWKSFVANRVVKIHEFLCNIDCNWNYINTRSNPADLATRGCNLETLEREYKWWHGPEWLIKEKRDWPQWKFNAELNKNDVEAMDPTTTLLSVEEKPCLTDKVSSFMKLLRIVTYCIRFIKKIRNQWCGNFIDANENRTALRFVLRLHQAKNFKQELEALTTGKQVNTKSRLRNLNPFIDNEGLIRVGGRIHNSGLDYDKCHPYILEKNDNLAKLIIDFEHNRHYHANIELLRTIISRRFWIIGAKSAIKNQIHKCMTCIRWRAQVSSQLMGQLPASRLVPSRPFSKCGVDYAGPITTTPYKGRCNKTMKSYIALFVCFTTRAVHLELVSDLSTDAFIAALKRFVARRGRPKDIYSDNGKNFVGTKAVFEKFREFLRAKETKTDIGSYCAGEFINWHHIPAYTPHMGGLWEAGIKSVKTHLRSTIGDKNLTFEELTTILAEIEACLNSRPLTELSSDPNDIAPLTPGHFLTGAPLTAVPEQDISETRIGLINRWLIIRKISQQFWKRWSDEYLSRLQTRNKWNKKTNNVKIGELVLIKGETTSPLKWPLGRVFLVHPGKDDLVRVVSIKTSCGIIRRSVHNIVRLPLSVEPVAQGGEYV